METRSHYVDQAGLELTEIKGTPTHTHPAYCFVFEHWELKYIHLINLFKPINEKIITASWKFSIKCIFHENHCLYFLLKCY